MQQDDEVEENIEEMENGYGEENAEAVENLEREEGSNEPMEEEVDFEDGEIADMDQDDDEDLIQNMDEVEQNENLNGNHIPPQSQPKRVRKKRQTNQFEFYDRIKMINDRLSEITESFADNREALDILEHISLSYAEINEIENEMKQENKKMKLNNIKLENQIQTLQDLMNEKKNIMEQNEILNEENKLLRIPQSLPEHDNKIKVDEGLKKVETKHHEKCKRILNTFPGTKLSNGEILCSICDDHWQ